MTDLNLKDVLVLALALEIVETKSVISEIPAILEDNGFVVTTKAFSAHDLCCLARNHGILNYETFSDRQLKAIQIKNILEYLEENTAYAVKFFNFKELEENKTYFFSNKFMRSRGVGSKGKFLRLEKDDYCTEVWFENLDNGKEFYLVENHTQLGNAEYQYCTLHP